MSKENKKPLLTIEYKLNKIDAAAKSILNTISNTTILFNAQVGCGKTTLIKALLKHLESKDTVSSPTFSIINEYKIKDNKFAYHFDLYRIKSLDEAYNFGIEEYLYNNTYKFIEWPELIIPILDFNYHTITITILESNNRLLKLC